MSWLHAYVQNNLQHKPRLERSSLTEVNAKNHAEITSDSMATIPQNLESKRVIHPEGVLDLNLYGDVPMK